MSAATATTRAGSATLESESSHADRPYARPADAPEAQLEGWKPSGIGIDGWSTLMTVQQRNLAACMLANQRLVEAAQVALQHELRFLERSMQDSIARSREILGETDPTRRIEQRLELQRQCLEQMMGHAQQLYDLLAKPQLEALEILSRRALASLEELGGVPDPDA